MRTDYEVIIIGGSYAGLSAALTLGRSLRHVLVLDDGRPCNANVSNIHNLPGLDGILRNDYLAMIHENVENYNTVEFQKCSVANVTKSRNRFIVEARDNTIKFSSSYLIIATGLEDVLPEIKGIQECWGKSVLHCPYCHGYELKNKTIGILPGEENTVVFARLLLGWTDHLTIFTNGYKLTKKDVQWFEKTKNITVVNEPVKELLHQEGIIAYVSAGRKMYNISALFTMPKHRQKSIIAGQLGCKIDDDGLIKTETSQATSIKHVFACGDVCGPRIISYALFSGSIAGMSVHTDLSRPGT